MKFLQTLRTTRAQTAIVPPEPASEPNRVYRAPLFLLRPPENAAIPFTFTMPTLEDPVSQLCTANQLDDRIFRGWCAQMAVPPKAHRKTWEWCYILQCLRKAGMIAPGRRGIGFGTGREPVPSVLAKHGVQVLATDAPDEVDIVQGWATSAQQSEAVHDLHHAAILPEADFQALVSFRKVDMKRIPADLRDFDFCWSSCAFEHLGSLADGADFVENCLDCLRPGGIAVHTTEFNLDSNDATIENGGLSVYRKRDIEALFGRLIADGHEVWPLNTHPGFSEVDQYIDLPPYYQDGQPHIKLTVLTTTLTSMGLVVRKAIV